MVDIGATWYSRVSRNLRSTSYSVVALMATSSLAVEGRGAIAQAEHDRIVQMIEARDEDGADDALRAHISVAFMTRLKQEAAQREEES